MKKKILLGTLIGGLISLSLIACARKHKTVAPPLPAPTAVTQPAAPPEPAPAPAPVSSKPKRIDYVKK